MPNTSEPRRTRSVAIARPASAAVASNVGEIVSPAFSLSPMKWSATYTPSQPVASACVDDGDDVGPGLGEVGPHGEAHGDDGRRPSAVVAHAHVEATVGHRPRAVVVGEVDDGVATLAARSHPSSSMTSWAGSKPMSVTASTVTSSNARLFGRPRASTRPPGERRVERRRAAARSRRGRCAPAPARSRPSPRRHRRLVRRDLDLDEPGGMRRLGDHDLEVREHVGGTLVGVEDEGPSAVVACARSPRRRSSRSPAIAADGAGRQLVDGHVRSRRRT